MYTYHVCLGEHIKNERLEEMLDRDLYMTDSSLFLLTQEVLDEDSEPVNICDCN